MKTCLIMLTLILLTLAESSHADAPIAATPPELPKALFILPWQTPARIPATPKPGVKQEDLSILDRGELKRLVYYYEVLQQKTLRQEPRPTPIESTPPKQVDTPQSLEE